MSDDAGVTHHAWRIEPAQYERHEQRRGRRHAFESLDPARTALVVIDMVPFFVAANPFTRGIVPAINRLARACRNAGGTVAWVVPATVQPMPARAEFFGPEVTETYRRSGGEGRPEQRVDAALETDPADLHLEKSAPSAFFPGSSALHDELTRRLVDSVIVTGTVANVCVESSVRDASTLGYRTIVAADAVSAMRDDDLNASLHTIYRSFGDVRSTEDITSLLLGETDVRPAD